MNKNFLTLVFVFLSSIIVAQNDLHQILKNKSISSKHQFYKDISDVDGNHVKIPVFVLKGKNKGPVFTIISGVHGYEYPPIIAAQTLIQELKPELVSGTIVIIPMTNPSAFYGRSPFVNPIDGLNLNRSFPGDKQGSETKRIANYITNVVIPESDVFVDIHGGDANEDLLPFVCYYNNEEKLKQTEKAKQLSESSGFSHIVSYPYTLKEDKPAKYAFKQAVQDGKIALSIECGKLGTVQKDAVYMIKRGIYNMLAEMKMYPKTEGTKNDFINLNKQVYIKSEIKGVFYSSLKSGDKVKKGDVVGSIKNEFGNIISKITAKDSGIILYKIGTPPVNKGETIMCIASQQ